MEVFDELGGIDVFVLDEITIMSRNLEEFQFSQPLDHNGDME